MNTMYPLSVLLLVTNVAFCEAFSSGEGTSCDAYGNFGCRIWNNGDRLNCIDPDQGEMPWAAAPVYTDKYSLRSGDGDLADDPTVYYPSSYITIFLSVNDPDYKFRGLLLHAVDSNNETVGSWDFSDVDDSLFHSPFSCPQAVLHIHADKKPYNPRLTFVTPAAGTGTISFRALIKRGPANTGEFYYPNGDTGDLVLNEGSKRSVSWIVASREQSCSEACKQQGLFCNAEETQNEDTASLVFGATTCNSPVLYDCSEVSPVLGIDGTCYLHSDSCEYDADASTACLSVGLSPSNNQRICACSNAMDYFLSSITVLFAVVSFGANEKAFTRIVLLAMLVAALSNVAQVSAHNWLETPGRAATEASTLRPCRGRKSSDTHVQLGNNSNGDFVIKWATGHSRDTFFSIIHEDYAYYLALSNYSTMVAEYIDEAPAEANLAFDVTYKRYHGIREGRDTTFYDAGGDGMYLRAVPESDPYYIDHPFSRAQELYEYSLDAISNDKRVAYKSEKYPWMIAAAKFGILTHQPQDFDVAKLTLPPETPAGHYIVNYKWSGYYDCVDIVKHDVEIPENETYGIDVGGFRWNRIDHCQYIGAQEIYSSCGYYNTSVESLIQEVEDDPLNFNYGENDRVGINCIKAQNPSRVSFPELVNIPWENSTCSISGLPVLHNGETTRSDIDWTGWQRTEVPGTRCIDGNTISTVSGTLAHAVYACGADSCAGISWLNNGSDMFTGEHQFILCEDFAGAVADSEYVSFEKAVTPLVESLGPLIDVSFQPDDNIATNDYIDTGELYGPKSDQVFGWNCDTSGFMQSVGDTANSTYVLRPYRKCASGETRKWEIALSDGLYTVATVHGRGIQSPRIRTKGCYIENVQLENTIETLPNDEGGTDSTRLTYVKDIHVTRGNLTFQGEHFDCRQPCTFLNRIMIQRKYDSPKSVWGPTTPNPWLQYELAEPEPIGAVTINLPDSCGAFNFYKGVHCDEDEIPGGFLFDLAEEGAVVRVSNDSCTGTACSGVVCSVIDKAEKCPYRYRGGFCPLLGECDPVVQCNGVVGRFVSVQLPGSERILDFEITVNRVQPVIPDEGFICYSLLSRDLTNTVPEYEISLDPDDPIFYSTCFVRERNILFLSELKTTNINAAQFKFDDQCVSCEAVEENLNSNLTDLTTWVFADQCVNCATQMSVAWNVGTDNELDAVSPIALVASGAVVATVLFAAIAIYRSKKHRSEAGPPLENTPEERTSNAAWFNWGNLFGRRTSGAMEQEAGNNDNQDGGFFGWNPIEAAKSKLAAFGLTGPAESIQPRFNGQEPSL